MTANLRQWDFGNGLRRADFACRRLARKAARAHDKFQFGWFAHLYHLSRITRIRNGIVLPGEESFLLRAARSLASAAQTLAPAQSASHDTRVDQQVTLPEDTPVVEPTAEEEWIDATATPAQIKQAADDAYRAAELKKIVLFKRIVLWSVPPFLALWGIAGYYFLDVLEKYPFLKHWLTGFLHLR